MKFFESFIILALTLTTFAAAAPTGVGSYHASEYRNSYNNGHTGDEYGGHPEDKQDDHVRGKYSAYPRGEYDSPPAKGYDSSPVKGYGNQPAKGYNGQPREYKDQGEGGYVAKPGGEYDVAKSGPIDKPVYPEPYYGSYNGGKYTGQPIGGYVAHPGGVYGTSPGGYHPVPRDVPDKGADYGYYAKPQPDHPVHPVHLEHPEHLNNYDQGPQYGKYPRDYKQPNHNNGEGYDKYGAGLHGDYQSHPNTQPGGYYARDDADRYPAYSAGYNNYNNGRPGSQYGSQPSDKYNKEGKYGARAAGYNPAVLPAPDADNGSHQNNDDHSNHDGYEGPNGGSHY